MASILSDIFKTSQTIQFLTEEAGGGEQGAGSRGKGAGGKMFKIRCLTIFSEQVNLFMPKNKNIYYAYGTLRERDV